MPLPGVEVHEVPAPEPGRKRSLQQLFEERRLVELAQETTRVDSTGRQRQRPSSVGLNRETYSAGDTATADDIFDADALRVRTDRNLLVPVGVERYTALLHQHGREALAPAEGQAAEVALHDSPFPTSIRSDFSVGPQGGEGRHY